MTDNELRDLVARLKSKGCEVYDKPDVSDVLKQAVEIRLPDCLDRTKVIEILLDIEKALL